MIEIGNKKYRNIPEQVQKNKEDIEKLSTGAVLLAEFGIKVIGHVDSAMDLPDPETYEGEFGDAYTVGTSTPYDYYIFTRPFEDSEIASWFNVGEFPKPGPKGDKGDKGDDGESIVGPQGVGIATAQTISTTSDDQYTYSNIRLTKTDGNTMNFSVAAKHGATGPRGYKGDRGDRGPAGPAGGQTLIIDMSDLDNREVAYQEIVVQGHYATLLKYDDYIYSPTYFEPGEVPEYYTCFAADENYVKWIRTTIDAEHERILILEQDSYNIQKQLEDSSEIVVDSDNSQLHLAQDVTNKLAKALVTPMQAPSSDILVGVDTTNGQQNIAIGSGLKIENGALVADGGGSNQPLYVHELRMTKSINIGGTSYSVEGRGLLITHFEKSLSATISAAQFRSNFTSFTPLPFIPAWKFNKITPNAAEPMILRFYVDDTNFYMEIVAMANGQLGRGIVFASSMPEDTIYPLK